MHVFDYDGFHFFIFENAVSSPEDLQGAVAAYLNFFIKNTESGEIRFVVTSFLLRNGQLVPAVQSIQHLPLLQEVLDALEARRG